MSDWQKTTGQINPEKGSALDAVISNMNHVLKTLEGQVKDLEKSRKQAELEVQKITAQSESRRKSNG